MNPTDPAPSTIHQLQPKPFPQLKQAQQLQQQAQQLQQPQQAQQLEQQEQQHQRITPPPTYEEHSKRVMTGMITTKKKAYYKPSEKVLRNEYMLSNGQRIISTHGAHFGPNDTDKRGASLICATTKSKYKETLYQGSQKPSINKTILELFHPISKYRKLLSLVHSNEYIDKLYLATHHLHDKYTTQGEAFGYKIDGDTTWSLRMAESVLENLKIIYEYIEKIPDATKCEDFFKTNTQPFYALQPSSHHATKKGGQGFCPIATTAILARSLAQKEYNILVVDTDIHKQNWYTSLTPEEQMGIYCLDVCTSHVYEGMDEEDKDLQLLSFDNTDHSVQGADKNLTRIVMQNCIKPENYIKYVEKNLGKKLESISTSSKKPLLVILDAGFDTNYMDPAGIARPQIYPKDFIGTKDSPAKALKDTFVHYYFTHKQTDYFEKTDYFKKIQSSEETDLHNLVEEIESVFQLTFEDDEKRSKESIVTAMSDFVLSSPRTHEDIIKGEEVDGIVYFYGFLDYVLDNNQNQKLYDQAKETKNSLDDFFKVMFKMEYKQLAKKDLAEHTGQRLNQKDPDQFNLASAIREVINKTNANLIAAFSQGGYITEKGHTSFGTSVCQFCNGMWGNKERKPDSTLVTENSKKTIHRPKCKPPTKPQKGNILPYQEATSVGDTSEGKFNPNFNSHKKIDDVTNEDLPNLSEEAAIVVLDHFIDKEHKLSHKWEGTTPYTCTISKSQDKDMDYDLSYTADKSFYAFSFDDIYKALKNGALTIAEDNPSAPSPRKKQKT